MSAVGAEEAAREGAKDGGRGEREREPQELWRIAERAFSVTALATASVVEQPHRGGVGDGVGAAVGGSFDGGAGIGSARGVRRKGGAKGDHDGADERRRGHASLGRGHRL